MIIQLENISKSFKSAWKDVHVLKDLNFKIDQSGKFAIVGKSGSGKSTLLALLSGIQLPSKGSVSLLDTDLSLLGSDKLADFRATQIGIVFQQFHLIDHLNALENVALPLLISGALKSEANEKAKSLLAEVGLENRMDHMPNQLSGGEKQRVAIARSLIHDPKIILADEPSGSLDEETGEKIMNLLFNLCQKKSTTLILVTHSLELAQRCDQVYKLEHGKLS